MRQINLEIRMRTSKWLQPKARADGVCAQSLNEDAKRRPVQAANAARAGGDAGRKNELMTVIESNCAALMPVNETSGESNHEYTCH